MRTLLPLLLLVLSACDPVSDAKSLTGGAPGDWCCVLSGAENVAVCNLSYTFAESAMRHAVTCFHSPDAGEPLE